MGTLADIRTVLIANRGEIACRVARTVRQLGIRTIAVYSDADRNALHVRSCDAAVRIGPAPASQSYLSIEAILGAAAEVRADAIHPGYGFLSENAEFAERCRASGMTFVGPPVAALRSMGLKTEAKELMQAAGVPVLPGYQGEDQDPGRLKQEARKLGFPLLIKPSAGGGGKGMRKVEKFEDFDAALAFCRRESLASFGDDAVLIERYLIRPRHIEVQIFADAHGQCVSLFERDCSVQRRHQKVLEEAPAPGLALGERRSIYAAAEAAAKAVSYVGAGTVEFLRSGSGEFYFMEMNTRLQVEHPVTEMITGLDLVEWQLRIAAGERLPLQQADLRQEGHAIEARIYAEDPARGFLPSAGTLLWFAHPQLSAHVRLDVGAEQGDTITAFYDPMIAKLIVWDQDREGALRRIQAALSQVQIAGVSNNVGFLERLVGTRSFVQADLDTELIEREHGVLFESRGAVGAEAPAPDALIAAACAILADEGESAVDPSPWAAREGWRLNGTAVRVLSFMTEAHSTADTLCAHDVVIRYGSSSHELTANGRSYRAAAQRLGGSRYRLTIDGRILLATVVHAGAVYSIFLPGHREVLHRLDPFAPPRRAEAGAASLRAPMPGRIVTLNQLPGATVRKADPLLVMEAMKMEHTIVAPADGRVVSYRYAAGDQVTEGAELLHFELAER